MSTIQNMAARARRECDINGLPAGEYIYSDPLKAKENESGAISEQYGSIANWREWDRLEFSEANTGKTLFHSDIRALTGVLLTESPSKAIEALDQSKYLIRVRW